MQMTGKNTQIIVPALFMVLIGILSTAAPSPALKMLFIIFGFCGVILCFCRGLMGNERLQRAFLWAAGAGFAGLLLWSILSAGSLGAYFGKLQSFFRPLSADAVYQEASDESIWLESELSRADGRVLELIKEMERSSAALEEYQFLSGRRDPEEIERLAGLIERKLAEDAEKESSSFGEIKTDVQILELFYKMRMTQELCYYSNLIEAFESLGIDCREMKVDEYVLMLWDVEYLFAVYSMRQDRLNDAARGVVYEEPQKLYFQQFKVQLDEYSDIFGYGQWYKEFDPEPAQRIVEHLDEKIMNYYKKFHMNFQKDVE